MSRWFECKCWFVEILVSVMLVCGNVNKCKCWFVEMLVSVNVGL